MSKIICTKYFYPVKKEYNKIIVPSTRIIITTFIIAYTKYVLQVNRDYVTITIPFSAVPNCSTVSRVFNCSLDKLAIDLIKSRNT